MSQLRGLIASGLLIAGVTACAFHEPVPAFRSTVWIGDRGISVPLPPPSFFEAPKQKVELAGEVTQSNKLKAGTEVHVVDNRGDAEATVVLDAGQSAFEAGLSLDLSDSCLEVWLVAPGGTMGDVALYSTNIVSDTEIEVVEGCSE
jgi:hypothetical protein